MRRLFTESEISTLHKEAYRHSVKELADMLGRGVTATRTKLNALKIDYKRARVRYGSELTPAEKKVLNSHNYL